MIHTFTKYHTLCRQMAALIHAQTGLPVSRLLTLTFEQLGLDHRDLLDIILAVEASYAIHIPDEVPLGSLDDFVAFIQSRQEAEASLALA